MTMQFLASVRRNQRQWMVVLTILSIFAFLFDDVARGTNNLSSNSTALFIAVMCAGVMCILGYPRGHATMYGLVGFIVGGAAALVGSTFAHSDVVARTNFGNFRNQDIRELQNRRLKVERFTYAIANKVKNQNPPRFGGLNENEMIGFAVMEREARKQGIAISDDAVNEFIKQATQDKLTKEDYVSALREAGVTESEIFDLIRSELAVQLVYRLTFPPANFQPFLPHLTNGQLTGRETYMTPLQLWDHFKKLHVSEKLTAVAVPITEFVRLVPTPSESEIKEFFDKHKNQYGDELGNPGFLEHPRIKLAYLSASDVEAYEKGLTKPTDQEVVDYYLKHKEEFRAGFEFPDSMTPPGGAANQTPDAENPENDKKAPPVDQPKPDAGSDSEKKADTEKKPDSPAPKEPENGEKKEADKPKPETDSDSQDEQSEDDSSNDEQGDDSPKPASDEAKPAQDDKPAADKTKADETKDAKAEPAKAPAPDENPPTPGKVPHNLALPDLSGTKSDLPKMPTPRYRELNDELKLEISEKIQLAKAQEKMGEAMNDALKYMESLELEYAQAEGARRTEIAEGFAKTLQSYAEKHGFEYHETKALTYRELASGDDPIGSASMGQGGPRQRSVADEVFMPDATGNGYQLLLYTARRADSPKVSYAYWKTEEIASKVADLKDEATHQLVVDAFKFDKARALAETRAQALVDLMKKGEADIPGALSGQTINGTPESPPVTVRETPKFTWLRSQQSFPMMGSSPMVSNIDGIDNPGYSFMKFVFEDVANGDFGVSINQSRTVYYALRVHDREAASDDGGHALQRLHQQFMNETFTNQWPTAYDYLSAQLQSSVDFLWRQNFNSRYGIKFEPQDPGKRTGNDGL